MNQRKELTTRLLSILKELERDQQYRGLKGYVRSLKQKSSLNGKKKYILKGATAYLKRLQADRKAKSLRLTPYTPYDEQVDEPDEQTQASFLAWDRTALSFYDSR